MRTQVNVFWWSEFFIICSAEILTCRVICIIDVQCLSIYVYILPNNQIFNTNIPSRNIIFITWNSMTTQKGALWNSRIYLFMLKKTNGIIL